jgi:hypothetical protein
MLKVHLRYPLLNPLSKGKGPSLRSLGSQSLASLRLGLSLVATLGFEMGILQKEATGSEGSFLKCLSSAKNYRTRPSPTVWTVIESFG